MTIKRLQRRIKELISMSEAEVKHCLRNDLLIDDFRKQSVLRFREKGFTATCSRKGVVDRIESVEEVRLFHLSRSRRERHGEIIVWIARCEHVIAQCETELAARSRKPRREIYRAVLKEEIARLRWEISRARRS
jgi:hypothetical protein